jgi:LEA14-like dessication related protein
MKIFLFPVLLCFAACATKAPPPEPLKLPPALSLSFDRIEAAGRDDITLVLRVDAENSRAGAMDISLEGWELVLNDLPVTNGVDLSLDSLSLAALSTGTIPVRIRLNGEALAKADQKGLTEYDAGIRLNLNVQFQDGENFRKTLEGQTTFPRIRQPEFSITTLAVVQAELINTRFKVKLRIDNPNNFPLELSALNYELYGAGRFWADGKETKVMEIPPQGFTEKDLFLLMNFMNMKREVLDQVIALQTVRYRFAGDVMVNTEIEYLPQFTMHFDRSGNSPVVQ